MLFVCPSHSSAPLLLPDRPFWLIRMARPNPGYATPGTKLRATIRTSCQHKHKIAKHTMAEPVAQEDGQYPRLNASMLKTGQYVGKIVSLAGRVEGFDGSTVTLCCADGANVPVSAADTDFSHPTGTFIEIVGFVNEDNTVAVRNRAVQSLSSAACFCSCSISCSVHTSVSHLRRVRRLLLLHSSLSHASFLPIWTWISSIA